MALVSFSQDAQAASRDVHPHTREFVLSAAWQRPVGRAWPTRECLDKTKQNDDSIVQNSLIRFA